MSNFGIVYVLKFCDSSGQSFYKIGLTRNDLKGRLSAIQTSIPFKLTVVKIIETTNFRKLEKNLHIKYLKFKVLNEWFCFHNEELNFLIEINQY